MIKQETIDKIIEEAEVIDVISDFLPLKKRGANYLGNCPFHNEKTPSFTVSPSKGIYKCFGCGASGTALKFVMEYNQSSYPEALRYLADKYKIEIEETYQSKEEKEKQDRNSSLHIVNNHANEHFKNNLHRTEEGQTIGMSYFKERGFRMPIIEKFELGYSIDDAKHFTNKAIEAQYEEEYLKELGLTSQKGFDFFRGRVIFPIHNISGKVIGFGGRTLRNDKKTAKYFNSPESPVYHKSKVLYGIFQAKKSIAKLDEAYLVEGYTDVISLSQAGIENVVASSGTALTEGQIRLIKRFTPNVTVLYDGDAAGLKAAFRGIDLILEQDMNVKVVLLPDGEDPDSFVKQNGAEKFRAFVDQKKKDFIPFKASVLLKDAVNDPVKKTDVIRDIVTSISKIPDPIKRSLFIKDCSGLLDMEESILVTEMNKMLGKNLAKAEKISPSDQSVLQDRYSVPSPSQNKLDPRNKDNDLHERELLRCLLDFGHLNMRFKGEDDEEFEESVISYILEELEDAQFQNPTIDKIWKIYKEDFAAERATTVSSLSQREEKDIQDLVISLSISEHCLSPNWLDQHEIVVSSKEDNFQKDIENTVARFRLVQVETEIERNQLKMKTAESEEDLKKYLETHLQYIKLRKYITDFLGNVIP